MQKLYKFISFAVLIYSINIFADTEPAKNISTYNPSQYLQNLQTDGLRPEVLNTALKAYSNAIKKGVKVNKDVITIIDYSMPSSAKRMWILDLRTHKVLFHTYVAHGKYSGENLSEHFSDRPGSQESSIGVYLTKGTYSGHNGYSLILHGLEKGFNANAESRRIVMHGAQYVGENMVETYGRIGRSWGCPAVEPTLSTPIINTIKDGSLVVAYFPDSTWMHKSVYLA